MTPVTESRLCLHCGDELRFDPWMQAWVDRHHATKYGPLRKNATAGPHVHKAMIPE